jgi:hypothetical protein
MTRDYYPVSAGDHLPEAVVRWGCQGPGVREPGFSRVTITYFCREALESMLLGIAGGELFQWLRTRSYRALRCLFS